MKTLAPFAVASFLSLGCAATHHPTAPSTLGVARSSTDLEALVDVPGPLVVETIASADWEAPRAGVLNLDHPHAKSAGLVDGPEKIMVPFHVVTHPTRGMFLIDTGVERAVHDPERAVVRGLVASAMDVEHKVVLKQSLGAYLDQHGAPAGVFLTHLHLDHVLGMPDVPKGTPIFTGPGETKPTSMQNMIIGSTMERALEGHAALQEWQFTPDAGGRFDGVVDVFGDGSLWALWVPGHTPGSTAYLARTAQGAVLFTGDASHTRWGWDHDVEPGTYSGEAEQGAASFAKLRAFVKAHPRIDVRVGHQR
jgi:glyoxylase-like metal-dependent hydrolase (beta-lactamase superfamily II)